MKTRNNISLLLFMAIFAVLTACKGSDSPTPDINKDVITALSKTWTINSVTMDDQVVSGNWNGFQLIFDTNQNFTATELSDESILVWPKNGSYSFPNPNNAKLILRNDGAQISLTDITETSATLSFFLAGRNNGRTDGLIGQWEFVMKSL